MHQQSSNNVQPPLYSSEQPQPQISSLPINQLPRYDNNQPPIPLSPIRPSIQSSTPLQISSLSALQPSLHHFKKKKVHSSIQSILSQVDDDIDTHLGIVNGGSEGNIVKLESKTVEVDQYMIPYIHGKEQRLGTWKYKPGSKEKANQEHGILKKMSTLFKK